MYIENDICFLRVYLTDTCDNSVLAKIYLNDSKTMNELISHFFSSLSERRRVMVAGTGEKCLIKSFIAKNIDLKVKMPNIDEENEKNDKKENEKKENDKIINLDKRDANCQGGCIIY